MPPCAAPVWLRVGNTFVSTATDKSPPRDALSAAAMPAPPAPTMTTSYVFTLAPSYSMRYLATPCSYRLLPSASITTMHG